LVGPPPSVATLPDPVLVSLQRARYASLAQHQSPVPAATSTSCVLSRGGDGSKGTVVFWQRRPKALGEDGPDRGVHAPMPRDCVDRLHEAVSKAQVRSMEAFRCAQSLLWTFISCLQLGAVACRARASSTMSPAVCTFSPVHLFPFFWLPLGALGVAPQGAREWQYTHHAHCSVRSMKKGRGDGCRRVTAGLACLVAQDPTPVLCCPFAT
jgi:hypothetical protein